MDYAEYNATNATKCKVLRTVHAKSVFGRAHYYLREKKLERVAVEQDLGIWPLARNI